MDCYSSYIYTLSLICCIQAGIMFKEVEKEKKESKPLEKIQMKHLIIAFLILGVGCFAAFVVFLIEKKMANVAMNQNVGS